MTPTTTTTAPPAEPTEAAETVAGPGVPDGETDAYSPPLTAADAIPEPETETEAQPEEPAPAESCPRCKMPGEQVEGTAIWHCDACGKTWGDLAPPAAETAPSGQVVPHEPSQVPELPTMPLPGEWEQCLRMADAFSRANIAPKALRGKPADMALVLWTGRDLGIPMTSAMREIYIIEGSPSISPKLRLARTQMLGLGKIIPDPLAEQSTTTSTALALLPEHCQVCTGASGWLLRAGDAPMPCPACHTTGFKMAGPPHTYTWEDGKAAGLLSNRVDDTCTPARHICDYRDGQSTKYRCKDNWRHWPKNMLWWRASGFSADTYFPQAGLGLYSPDDLGAITDANGEIIDLDAIAIWSGDQSPTIDPADPEDVVKLTAEIKALSQRGKQLVVERLLAADIPKFDDPGFDAQLLRKARAIYAGVESQMRREESQVVQTRPDGTSPTADEQAAETAAKTAAAPEAPDLPEPTNEGEPAGETAGTRADETAGFATSDEEPEPESTASEAQVDEIIAEIKGLTEAQLDAKLVARGKTPKGALGARQSQLGLLMIHELTEKMKAGEP